MEIVMFDSHCEVWDHEGNRMMDGTLDECEDFISDNQEEDEYEHDFEDALEN